MQDATRNPVPDAREFTLIGLAYALFAFGLLAFWPAAAGLVIAYIRRGRDEASFINSHYSWLIRTFWWWTAWFVTIIVGMIVILIRYAVEIARIVDTHNFVNVPWAVLGTIVLGGFGLAGVWFWVVYRLVRGVVRLADGRAAP